MYQDLKTRHGLLIRLKGSSKRTSGNSLSPLEAQNKNLCVALQTLLTWVRLRLRRRLGCPKNAEKCWGFTVADPGEGPGEAAPPPPYFKTKLKPEGPKKNFFKGRPPSPPLSKGLDDRPPPSPHPSYLKGLDRALGLHEIVQFTSKEP